MAARLIFFHIVTRLPVWCDKRMTELQIYLYDSVKLVSFSVITLHYNTYYLLIFAEDKMRFGSIKHGKTPFSRLAVALTFHYLCRR